MQPLGLNALPTNQGWELARYFLLPQSVDLDDWIIFDTSVTIIVGALWQRSGYVSDDAYDFSGLLGLNAGENKTETGLSDIEGASTSNFVNKDANDIVTNRDDNSIPNVDMTWDKLQESTGFASHEQNYTVPENTVRSGVIYQAGDSKSTWEYATDIADSEGRTLLGVANATMVGFAYETFDDLQSVAVTFDEESAVSAGQEIGILRRATAWVKTKASTVNSYTGKVTNKAKLNIFKKISLARSSLTGIPSKATKFFTKTIPAKLQKVAKLGFGALTGGLKKAGKLLLTIGLILGAVILLAVVMRRNKGGFN
jgi:hypothetical protein